MPESSYRLIFFLYSAFLFFVCISAMEAPTEKEKKVRPQIVSRKRFNESLYNKTSEAFKKHCSLIYCKTLLEQSDSFSCGYRALFNARCLQIAADQAIIRGNSIEDNLEPLLKNENSFSNFAKKLQDHIIQTDPTYNLALGMDDRHMLSFVANHMTTLKERLLPIYLTNKTVSTVSNVDTDSRTYTSIDRSTQLHNHLRMLAAPFESAHFACLLPRHWVLASIITDAKNVAKLYIMDSNNSYLENNPNMTIMVKKLLEYVEEVNARNNFFTSVNSSPRPLAQSAPVPQ